MTGPLNRWLPNASLAADAAGIAGFIILLTLGQWIAAGITLGVVLLLIGVQTLAIHGSAGKGFITGLILQLIGVAVASGLAGGAIGAEHFSRLNQLPILPT